MILYQNPYFKSTIICNITVCIWVNVLILQEISAFGEGGRGDTGDVWTVMCEGDYWTRDDSMMLKHVDTGMYLAASGHTFGRPIQGQVQI